MHNSTNDKLCVCTPTKRVVVIHIRLVLSYLFLVVVYWEMFNPCLSLELRPRSIHTLPLNIPVGGLLNNSKFTVLDNYSTMDLSFEEVRVYVLFITYQSISPPIAKKHYGGTS